MNNTTTVYEGVPMGGSPINRVAIDRFTALHLLSGFVATYAMKWAGWINYSLPVIFIGAIAWEIWEPMLKDWNPDIFPNPTHDSTINKTYDVLAALAGWALAMAVMNK